MTQGREEGRSLPHQRRHDGDDTRQPGPPRSTHRGSSPTPAGGPGVRVSSLGAQIRHSAPAQGTDPHLPGLLKAPAKVCEAEKGGSGRLSSSTLTPRPWPTRLPGPFPGTVTRGRGVSPREPGSRVTALAAWQGSERRDRQREATPELPSAPSGHSSKSLTPTLFHWFYLLPVRYPPSTSGPDTPPLQIHPSSGGSNMTPV